MPTLEQPPAVIPYHGTPRRARSASPAGIALFIWSPFLFVMSVVFGIMAASIVALFCSAAFASPFNWSEFPVTLALLPLSILPGLACLALFRSGLAAITMANQFLRGQLPALDATLQKVNTLEAIIYVIAAFAFFVALSFSLIALAFSAFFLVVAIALTATRVVLNRARAAYLQILTPGAGQR